MKTHEARTPSYAQRQHVHGACAQDTSFFSPTAMKFSHFDTGEAWSRHWSAKLVEDERWPRRSTSSFFDISSGSGGAPAVRAAEHAAGRERRVQNSVDVFGCVVRRRDRIRGAASRALDAVCQLSAPETERRDTCMRGRGNLAPARSLGEPCARADAPRTERATPGRGHARGARGCGGMARIYREVEVGMSAAIKEENAEAWSALLRYV
jgi:hypothetical protein